MATKTITVTEESYNALKFLKTPSESFSETILRVAKKRPLSEFFGILSGEKGEKFESSIIKLRKMRNSAHRSRIAGIVKSLKETN